jgi:hypothetical protein
MLPITARPPRFALDAASTIAMTVLAASLVLVLATSFSSPLKDDVAWLLYVTRKWLGGQRLYQDLVEINPPLIIWIYALPASVAGWLGVSPKTISAPFFAAFLLGCAGWTARLLRGRAALFARTLPAFGAIGTVLLLLPGVEFGQREHLLVAAALPYLGLFAREMQGEPEPRTTAALAGVLAALGCALKPSYLLAFLMLELLGRARGARLSRTASLAAAATLALYGLGVLIFCPAFLENAVPLALALYGGTDTPCWQILLQSRELLAGVAVVVLLAALSRHTLADDQPFLRALLIGLAAFALAATISYVTQGKNWFYHRLPASTACVLALLLWGAAILHARPRLNRRLVASAALALLTLADGAWSDYDRLQTWVEAAVEPDLSTAVKLERLVRQEHAKTYIAFSEWIALGFPVVNDTGVTWASRFDSMWALRGELWRAQQDGTPSTAWPIRRWITRDFVANCPDLAVVDLREGINYVAVLSASDPAFADAWSRYHQIAAFDGLRVLKRDAAGCTAPSPRHMTPRMTAMVMEPP